MTEYQAATKDYQETISSDLIPNQTQSASSSSVTILGLGVKVLPFLGVLKVLASSAKEIQGVCIVW